MFEKVLPNGLLHKVSHDIMMSHKLSSYPHTNVVSFVHYYLNFIYLFIYFTVAYFDNLINNKLYWEG